ncbi:hypothetical protein [Denitratisoma oestradiolicum]|uniref:HTH iclR-type domain-containing protein n=1 Tax=Denitratisoma oestradiolicum TaxID=311182 RepID=A0A6S6XNX9_9PROT|nr:hypothetical protein [Denitratisoma oestradiolicum]TWO80490.1 hypothetical protein CBW56_08590 [Denitratisoma oestradiolicum]CAB1367556.1 conserved protein of unknown function [Denitratisoma oestradiolicum]
MARPALPDDFEQRFDQSFALVAFVANRFLVNQMRRVMVELGVDLECAFIYGTLGMLNVATEMPPGSAPSRVLDESGMLPENRIRPVRLSDLSQVAGLPRETIRRKLEKLRGLGKVERTADGAWQVCRIEADTAGRAFTRETVVRLLTASQEVNRVLDAALP